jgi:type VI secretion system protein VasG
MADITRKVLFGKLNQVGYRSIEAATVFCKMRGNPVVEVAHWIHQILQLEDSDLRRAMEHFGCEPGRVAADLSQALERLPRGATTIRDFASDLEEGVKSAWMIATLMYGESQVRTGHVLAALLEDRGLRGALVGVSGEFEKLSYSRLTDGFDEILGDSPEARMRAQHGFDAGAAAPGEASAALRPAELGRQEALEQFTVDLTEQARNGEIDAIVGRDPEIRQLIDILMRRRQNNPILTGEAGVGKTAVVEGFAHKIASGDVPPPLRNVSLRTLDVGLLQAGASMKGEFENRLKQVIEEVQSSERPIILFIDEAHTLIGAGGAAGTGDAANLLKPALARGTLRTVAATTWGEYKEHIEKDPALTRRFQVVQVDEPSDDQAIQMMRAMASVMESHHRIQLLDEAIEAAVKLSSRYIQGRQLPDKSVSVLDTACARVAISQHAVPAEVDDARRRISAVEQELQIIARERDLGIDTEEREQRAQAALRAEQERLAVLQERWEAEQALVRDILATRAQLRGAGRAVDGRVAAAVGAADDPGTDEATAVAAEGLDGAPALDSHERSRLVERLVELQGQLRELQGDRPLILPTVDAQAVASVVGDWTGIPVGRMVKDELSAVLDLAETLKGRIVGQDHALEIISRRVRTSRANLDNPGKPIGVFMLAGSSGVGKTETALALAEALYGGEQNLITINMSEYQEAHTVSTLKGAPPGYKGYGKGGVLTEAVRRKPYSVVLLDEVEKAHSDVHEIFFQVFDKGRMDDSEGRTVDFKNTLILLTTNVGTDLIMSLCSDPELMPDPEGIAKALREPLLKVFPPALLGRLVVVPYHPLDDQMIRSICEMQLGRIHTRIEEHHGVPFHYDDGVIELITRRCTDLDSGGRMIDAILTNTVLPTISEEILRRMIEGTPIQRVDLSASGEEFAYAYD